MRLARPGARRRARHRRGCPSPGARAVARVAAGQRPVCGCRGRGAWGRARARARARGAPGHRGQGQRHLHAARAALGWSIRRLPRRRRAVRRAGPELYVSAPDYRELSMLELFKLEAETQTQVLTDALLVLEHDATSAASLEACMRASHSLKGAARIVGLNPGVSLTHAMEDCFVAAQNGRITLLKPQIDLLLQGVDLIAKVANASDADLVAFSEHDPPEVDAFVGELEALLAKPATPELASSDAGRRVPETPAEAALDDAPAPS